VNYVGRFAPSPSGPLHLGSLTTALASCLEARAHGGSWLLRIEDVDTPRCAPGQADALIATLDQLGFEWDGPVIYQSRRLHHYEAALTQLQRAGLTYECGCSRRELAETQGAVAYPGHCRTQRRGRAPFALRFRGDSAHGVSFADALQGPQHFPWATVGDPIIRRRDQLYAYQLAVVVDDTDSAVSHIVRGVDLLNNTPWQLALRRALGMTAPEYLHLPLVTNADGSKLSKSTQAVAIPANSAVTYLYQALKLLCQLPPVELQHSSLPELWMWAREHWRPANLAGIRRLPVDSV
jgi:glutamyl-Q tRNA(Asp) synthetase